MRISEFAFLLVQSLNPANYHILSQKKKREAFKYFLILLFFSLVLGFFFSIPRFMEVPNKIEGLFTKFEKFNITGVEVHAKEPIVILKYPKTVLDLTDNEVTLTDEFILITKSDIFWRKWDPNIFPFRLFEQQRKEISQYSNILENVGTIRGGAFWLLFIIFLPSLFFIAYNLNFIKYVLLILLETGIGFSVVKLKKKRVTLLKIWRTAVFSSTIMIVLEVVFSPLFNYSIYFSIFPWILYLLMFYLSMLVVSEKEINLKKVEPNA